MKNQFIYDLFENPALTLEENLFEKSTSLNRLKPDDLVNVLALKKGAELSIYEKSTGIISNTTIDRLYRVKNILSTGTRQKKGVTFFVTRIEEHIPELGEIISSLNSRFFPRRFNAAISISNEGSIINTHCDDADVLIIQIQGKRLWNVWNKDILASSFLSDVLEGTVRNIDSNLANDESVYQFQLIERSGLFIPALYPHGAKSLSNTNSIGNMTISISIIGELLSIATFVRRYAPDLYSAVSECSISNELIHYNEVVNIEKNRRVEYLRAIILERIKKKSV